MCYLQLSFAVAFMLLCCSVSGSQVLEELWSLDLDLNINAGAERKSFLVTPAKNGILGSTFLVADDRGVLYCFELSSKSDSAKPTLQWSYPGPSNLSFVLKDVQFNSQGDVLATYSATSLTDFADSVQKLLRLDGSSGEVRWRIEHKTSLFSGAQALGDEVLLVGKTSQVDTNTFFELWNLTSGLLMWNVSKGYGTVTNIYSPMFLAANESIGVVYVSIFDEKNRTNPIKSALITIDLSDGAIMCTTPSINSDDTSPTTGFAVAGERILVGLERKLGETSLLSARSCEVIQESIGPTCHSQAFGNRLYSLANISDGRFVFSQLSDNGFSWTTPEIQANTSCREISFGTATRTADNFEATVLNVNGYFFAIDLESGDLKWNTSRRLPFLDFGSSTRSLQGEEVFPLGDGVVFIPNLQGYVIANVSGEKRNSDQIMEMSLDRPILGAAALKNSTLLVGDYKAGRLFAFKMKS